MATILVSILGDAKQFKSELAGASAETEKASGGFAKLAKVALIAGVAVAGGVAYGLTKSVEAAAASQQATARLNAAFAASHVSAKAFADGIDQAESSARNLGFTNEDVRGALGSLIVATHDGGKAIKDLGVAQDIARFKGVTLGAATKLLTGAMAGQSRATKTLGIDVPKVTTAQDALAASTKNHTSEAYKNALAHAKIIDKLSTENAVIATVTEKLHGQADAYASTADGSMAVFHAQLQNIEEKVGTALLPVLTRLTNWLTAELPVAVADAQKAITFLTPYFDELKADVNTVVSFVEANWPMISTVISRAFQDAKQAWEQYLKPAIADIIAEFDILEPRIASDVQQIASLIERFVSQVRQNWGTLTQIFGPTIVGAFEVAKMAVTAALTIIQSTLDAFENILHGHWSAAWNDLKTIVSTALDAAVSIVETILKSLATTAFNLATLVAQQIAKGIKAAVPLLTGLAGDLIGKLTDEINQVANEVLTEAEKIGTQLISGVVNGLSGLGAAVKSKIEGTLSTVLKHIDIPGFSPPDHAASEAIGQPLGQGVIDGWLLSSASLPSAMTTSLQAAITAGRTVIANAQSSFQSAWQQITSDADAALGKLQGSTQTAAGAKLTKLQDQHDTAGRTQAVTDAQTALATAQAGGDPAAILAAQQQLADAKYAIQVAALQKQASLEQVQLDARNALQQRNFDDALTALQAHLAKGQDTYAQAHAAILKLFKSFGVNYASAGATLGAAFIQGLKDSIQGAAAKAGSLSGQLKDVAAGINVPHAATGGYVAQTGLAVIHQGETITPASQVGQGGGNVYIYGIVGDEQVEQIRNIMIRKGRNTSGGVLGGFG